jgi:curved DNA-binding protein CbpA
MKKMMKVSAAYEILQLERSATAAEINASYRRLIKEYHPDRNGDRSDWSHRMTVRLTEAYEAVQAYLSSLETSRQAREAEEEAAEREAEAAAADFMAGESDSGYSLTTQGRIAGLYDQVLDQIHSYYNEGMDKIYLRQEGSMRQRFRAVLRYLTHIIEGLDMASEMPGSAIQHGQINAIREFCRAFYENLLIKPKAHEILAGDDAKAQKLYRLGSTALDRAVFRGLLHLERDQGLICPGERTAAEKNFMYLLANYPRSPHVPETLIKLYLLKALSGLCDIIEQAAG